MQKLKIDGFQIAFKPIGEGDVGLVIRQDGTVEAVLESASADGREISAEHGRLKTILALIILLAQESLMETAEAEVDKKISQAMKLRIVN